MLYMEDTRKKATLIIDSDGGEIGAGLMIYDTLVNAKVPVDVCCVGKACSMAAILLAAGEKYTTIAKTTGASSTTVSRVNRCLNYGPGGYKKVLKAICKGAGKNERK